MNKLQNFLQNLVRPVDATPLAIFRILFGGIILGSIIHNFFYASYHYNPKDFHFTYYLFSFTPWPWYGMQIHFAVMAIAAIGLLLGLYYRICAIFLFISFSYLLLLERALYFNSYYFIILMTLLFMLIDANATLSIDKKSNPQQIPLWHILILRLQIIIVYFYSGVAKINSDWLHGEPMRRFLLDKADTPIIGSLLTESWMAYFFSYSALLFDVFIGFFLLWKRTRLLAVALILLFNLSSSWLLAIGIFPYLMIAATVLFFEPQPVKDLLKKWFSKIQQSEAQPQDSYKLPHPMLIFILIIYIYLQITIPLRHWLYSGNKSWTEEGYTFSWHIKTRIKDGTIAFKITDPKKGESWQAQPANYLNESQIDKMSTHPQMILLYAHFLRKQAHKKGIKEPIITATVLVSLNGRPYQYIIAPDTNLATIEYSLLGHAPWIIELDKESTIGNYSKTFRDKSIAFARSSEYMYQKGLKYIQGDRQNYPKALKWFIRAADHNHDKAMYTMGFIYSRGLGIKQNHRRAEHWFMRAATKGNSLAMLALGDLYRSKTKQNYSQATFWYRKGAKAGEPQAMNALGMMYYKGQGVSKSRQKAIKWLKKAADLGLEEAQKNLQKIHPK